MSSDRAGTPDEDAEWADYAAWIDRANTPSERAGTPTHGRLNRDKARVVVQYARNLPLADMDAIVDRLEACVVPDPRWARIETEVYGTEKPQNLEAALHMLERVRGILRGDA